MSRKSPQHKPFKGEKHFTIRQSVLSSEVSAGKTF